jgi:hypothetical protein
MAKNASSPADRATGTAIQKANDNGGVQYVQVNTTA